MPCFALSGLKRILCTPISQGRPRTANPGLSYYRPFRAEDISADQIDLQPHQYYDPEKGRRARAGRRWPVALECAGTTALSLALTARVPLHPEKRMGPAHFQNDGRIAAFVTVTALMKAASCRRTPNRSPPRSILDCASLRFGFMSLLPDGLKSLFRGPASKLAERKRQQAARTPKRFAPKFQTPNLFSPWCPWFSSSPLLNYLRPLGVLAVAFLFSPAIIPISIANASRYYR